MISFRPLFAFVMLMICHACCAGENDHYPRQVSLLELDNQSPANDARNWAHLLADLAAADIDSEKPLYFPELNSSLNEGLQLINRHCQNPDRPPDTCQLSSFEDLAYGLSKMNQWWTRAIWDSATNTSTLTMLAPLSTAVSSQVLINKRALMEVAAPEVKKVAASLWASRTNYLVIGRYWVIKVLEWRYKRLGINKVKKYGETAVRTAFTVLNYSLIYLAATATKVALDMTFSDRGAFFYFIYKHTLGQQHAYDDWYARMGSSVYRFDNSQTFFGQSPDYTARQYFSVELDMVLYRTLLNGYLNFLTPWEQGGEGSEPLVTALELSSSGVPLQLADLSPEEVEDRVETFLVQNNQCGILVMDASDRYFPAMYLSLCFREMAQVVFQLFNTGPRFTLVRPNMTEVIRHLVRISNSQRLIFYQRSTAVTITD
ncbi:MAG: hypothetical protein ACR2PT_21025 [Endozoicomonas sp.]